MQLNPSFIQKFAFAQRTIRRYLDLGQLFSWFDIFSMKSNHQNMNKEQ